MMSRNKAVAAMRSQTTVTDFYKVRKSFGPSKQQKLLDVSKSDSVFSHSSPATTQVNKHLSRVPATPKSSVSSSQVSECTAKKVSKTETTKLKKTHKSGQSVFSKDAEVAAASKRNEVIPPAKPTKIESEKVRVKKAAKSIATQKPGKSEAEACSENLAAKVTKKKEQISKNVPDVHDSNVPRIDDSKVADGISTKLQSNAKPIKKSNRATSNKNAQTNKRAQTQSKSDKSTDISSKKGSKKPTQKHITSCFSVIRKTPVTSSLESRNQLASVSSRSIESLKSETELSPIFEAKFELPTTSKYRQTEIVKTPEKCQPPNLGTISPRKRMHVTDDLRCKNMPSPVPEESPRKRTHLMDKEDATLKRLGLEQFSPYKSQTKDEDCSQPNQVSGSIKPRSCRKLLSDAPEPNQKNHSVKRLDFNAPSTNQSRMPIRGKVESSGLKLKSLKAALSEATEVIAKTKEYRENKFKLTSFISTDSILEPLSDVPAYQRYKHLVQPLPTEEGEKQLQTTALSLPPKYRALFEMFQSLDTVVSILHNRKERVTFDKIKKGVQKMMRKNFTKIHLGQIVSVHSTAYTLSAEKLTYAMKKADAEDFELVIVPNLAAGSDQEQTTTTFTPMIPHSLIERKNQFHRNLITIAKNHHRAFLNKSNFPKVPECELTNWHPEFCDDSVPDIEPSALPDLPEARICTAQDVLNKMKGAFQGKKINKALQSVAEESSQNKVEVESPKPKIPQNALRGVCNDLLERIRAKEYAKHLETMTRSPMETKRQAMLEKLPKLVQILWHSFIAERKAAIALDVAIEKIIHSFDSLTSSDSVKEHLKLIMESYPGWLTFVEVSKGTYLTMDKRKDIHAMLGTS